MSEDKISDYEVGQKVYVHAFGHWYAGEVNRIGRTKVHVEFTTGTGKTRVKPCSLDQIALEKLEGERARWGREKAERAQRDRERYGPVMVQTQIDTSGMNGIRLLAAFQVLAWPSGFYRGTTHKRARAMIEEIANIKLKRNANPPLAAWNLEQYLEWAANPELQNGGVDLEPGLHLVHTVRPGEEKDLLPGTPFRIDYGDSEERGMEIG